MSCLVLLTVSGHRFAKASHFDLFLVADGWIEHFVPTIAFDCTFTDVNEFSPDEQLVEGGQVAAKVELTHETTDGHKALLTVRVAFDLFPMSVVFGASDGLR